MKYAKPFTDLVVRLRWNPGSWNLLWLICILVILNGEAWGQTTTLYTQNFGTGEPTLPTGWTSSPTAGNNGAWVNENGTANSNYTGASGESNAWHTYNNPGTGTLTFSNNISTVGYTNITVLWGARRHGSNLPTFQYFNGTSWITVTYSDVTTTDTWMLVNGGTRITLPSGAEELSNLQLRWTHTSTGSSAYNNYRIDDFSIQGTLSCTVPTTQATMNSFTSTGNTGTTVNWTRGNITGGVIVVARLTATLGVNPANGTTYTANSVFGAGTGSQITGAGNYVVYVGTGTSVSVTGLASASNFTFTVYEYNSTGMCYLIPGATGAVSTTCSPPGTQASNGSYTNNTTGTSLTATWTRGSGTGVVVVARLTTTTEVEPSSGITYTANTSFGSGTGLQTTGTGNYVVYVGTGTTVNVSGLTGNSSYTFSVYEYGIGPCYMTPGSSSAVMTPLIYCTSSGNTSYQTSVTLVSINTINNITLNKTAGYNSFLGISTNLLQNNSYNLTINVNTDGNYPVYARVWVDWDHDGTFSTNTNEQYDLGFAQNTSNGATNLSPQSLTIPSTATLGITRMRVSARYYQYSTPCATNFDGEVEDYTLNVQTACTAPSGVTAGSNSPICAGSTLNLTSSASAGTTPFTYSWSGPNSFASTAQNPVITSVTTAASGTYQVTISNSCGSAGNSSSVTVNAASTAEAGGPDAVCQSATPSAITLNGASVGGGATTGAWSIVSGGGSLSSTAQTSSPATVTYTPANNYSGDVVLLLTSNNLTGCTAATDTRTITVNASSTIILTSGTQNQTVCSGTAITNTVYSFGGSANNASVTNLPAGLNSNVNTGAKTVTISGTPTAVGTYTITTSGHTAPCTAATIEGTISINALPQFSVSKTDITCFNANNGAITITASGGSGGYQYSLTGDTYTGTYGSINEFTGLKPDIAYTIKVKDSNQCEQTNCTITNP